jgi:hypothetical protein
MVFRWRGFRYHGTARARRDRAASDAAVGVDPSSSVAADTTMSTSATERFHDHHSGKPLQASHRAPPADVVDSIALMRQASATIGRRMTSERPA